MALATTAFIMSVMRIRKATVAQLGGKWGGGGGNKSWTGSGADS